MKEKIIVTGGAGFVGSHLVDLLLDLDYQVVCIDNLSNGKIKNIERHLEDIRFNFIENDIRNEIDPKIFQDSVYLFHLAGIGDVIPSLIAPEEYFSINLHGTFKVFNAARMGGIKKIIYAASSSCYGEAIVPTKEDALISTLHPYAVSKYLGEQLLFSMADIYSINVASVCIFNAYGRRFKTSGAYGSVIGVFLRQALSGAPLTIVGTGEQTRDFVHVRDVAEAFYLVAEYGKNLNRYNVGAGKSVTINDLARLISKDVKYIPERGGEAQHTLADITKIRSDTGWEPKTDFILGCNEMLEHIEEWSDAPLWTEDMIMEQVKTWKQYFTGEENV